MKRASLVLLACVVLFVATGFAATKKSEPHRNKLADWSDGLLRNGDLPESGSRVSSGVGNLTLSQGGGPGGILSLPPGVPDNWNGGTGNWSDAGNWNNGEPLANSDVTIYSGGNDNVTLDVGITTINSLTLGGASNGTTSELTDGGTVQTLAITNALTVGETGLLNLTGGSTVTGGADSSNAGTIQLANGSTLAITGNLDNSGNADLENGSTLQISGDVGNSGNLATDFGGFGGGNTVNIMGTLTNSGSFELEGAGDMATLGSLVNSGAVDVSDGSTLTVNGDATNSGVVTTNNSSLGGGNSLNVTGTLTNEVNGLVALHGPGDMATLGSLVNSGVVDVGNSSTLQVNGGVTNEGIAQFIVDGGSTATMSSLDNSAFIDVKSGSTLQVNGDATNSGNIATDFNGTGGAMVNITGMLTNQAGAQLVLLGPGDMATLGSLDNSGLVNVESAGSTLQVNGDVTNSGGIYTSLNGSGGNTINISGMLSNSGTFELGGPGDTGIIGNGATNNAGGLVDVENGSTLTIAGDVNNSGNLLTNQFGAGGGNNLTITGTLTNQAGGQFVLNGPGDMASMFSLDNSGFVDVEGGSTLQIGAGSSNSGNLYTGLNGTAGNKLSINGILTNSGNFELLGSGDTATVGNTTNSGTILVGGTASMATLAALDNSGLVDVEGGSTLQINSDADNSGSFFTSLHGTGANMVNIAATLLNLPGAQFILYGPGDMATIGQALNNSGLVDVENNSKLQVNGNASNGGTIATDLNGLGGGNTLQITGSLNNTGTGTLELLGAGDTGSIGNGLFNAGMVQVQNGSTLTISGDVTNPGTFAASFGGNTISISGNLNNTGTFQLNGPGDMATIGGSVTNNGNFQVLGNGSTATIGGDMSVGIAGGTGSLTVMDGATLTNQNGFVGNGAGSSGNVLVSGNGSSWTNLGNLSVGINGGSGLVVVNNGGTVTAQILTIGTLGEVDPKSGGTLNYTMLNNSGILDPLGAGNLIGTLLTVFPQGSVVLDVVGTAPGQYGQLDIKGSALFDGKTVIDFMNGFAPKKGDMFDFLNITGSADFSGDTVVIEGLQPGFEYSIDFANGEFTLTALNDGVPVPEPVTLLVLIPGLLGMGYGLRRKLSA